jgi:hypothetical protein
MQDWFFEIQVGVGDDKMRIHVLVLFVLLLSCKQQEQLVPRIGDTPGSTAKLVGDNHKFSDRGVSLRGPWGPTVTNYFFPYKIASVAGVLAVEYDTSVRVVAVTWQSGPLDDLSLTRAYYPILASHDSALGHVLHRLRINEIEDVTDAFESERGKRDSRRPLLWFGKTSDAELKYDSTSILFYESKFRR